MSQVVYDKEDFSIVVGNFTALFEFDDEARLEAFISWFIDGGGEYRFLQYLEAQGLEEDDSSD